MSPRLDQRQSGSNHQRSDRAAELPPLRLADLPAQFVTIDPGSVHCGVARWETDRGASTGAAGDEVEFVTTLRLVEVYERSPDALYIELRELKDDGISLVIAEDFRLQKGRNLQGSRLVTPRVLGVIEYICRQEGVLYREQVPGIKAYIDPWLRAQVPVAHGGGVEVDSLASNTHKRDAIRHGLYPALRRPQDRLTVRLVLTEHKITRGRPATVKR